MSECSRHAQVHRQKCRDRCHLGALAGKARPIARKAEHHPEEAMAGMGNSEQRRQDVAGDCEDAAPAMVGGAHLPAEGDGRLHRGQSRVRELLADFIGT